MKTGHRRLRKCYGFDFLHWDHQGGHRLKLPLNNKHIELFNPAHSPSHNNASACPSLTRTSNKTAKACLHKPPIQCAIIPFLAWDFCEEKGIVINNYNNIHTWTASYVCGLLLYMAQKQEVCLDELQVKTL